jgi:DNA-binding transcriptional ArsR family regulator
MPVQDYSSFTTVPTVNVSIEPVYNIIQSLLTLAAQDKFVGVGGWVQQTLDAMTPEERRRHVLVMVGLYFAVIPERSYSSFPAYLRHLDTMEADTLRDKMLKAYVGIHLMQAKEDAAEDAWENFDKQSVLASYENYINFLLERFGEENVDRELEKQAYRYACDPAAMKELITSHLHYMWDVFMADEWERVKPMVEDCVRAFSQVDLGKMSREEAVNFVTDQEVAEKMCQICDESERVILVPNAHIGPYLWRYPLKKSSVITFGAHLPKGVKINAPDLSRNDILVRLSALADDSRLRILTYIAEHGEQRSQDIMVALNMSQSAVSRHLTQLTATGYLCERRCEGAKCYRLNPERINETLKAISALLLDNVFVGQRS